jgi:ABC-type sulfate/molybdate transport systems ATPase subunit
MITVDSVKKYAGGKLILNVPQLTVHAGERVALIGANGSGKTTLLRIMAGILAPDEGKVVFTNTGLLPYYLPQQSLGFSMSVTNNLLTALPKTMSKADKQTAVNDILKALDLVPLAKKRGNRLSGGETQRMALARLLITPKSLLLLDEPASAADISGIDLIEAQLLDFCGKNKTTLVMATHSPKQALNIATRVILLQGGEIAESGAPRELLNNPQTEWGKRFIEHWKV